MIPELFDRHEIAARNVCVMNALHRLHVPNGAKHGYPIEFETTVVHVDSSERTSSGARQSNSEPSATLQGSA